MTRCLSASETHTPAHKHAFKHTQPQPHTTTHNKPWHTGPKAAHFDRNQTCCLMRWLLLLMLLLMRVLCMQCPCCGAAASQTLSWNKEFCRKTGNSKTQFLGNFCFAGQLFGERAYCTANWEVIAWNTMWRRKNQTSNAIIITRKSSYSWTSENNNVLRSRVWFFKLSVCGKYWVIRGKFQESGVNSKVRMICYFKPGKNLSAQW